MSFAFSPALPHALPSIAARLFGTPLLIDPAKLDIILAVLGPRLGNDATLASLLPGNSAPTERSGSVQQGIAVIPIYGSLVRRTGGLDALSGLTSYSTIAQQLEAALAADNVAGILLDIDSPGGEAGGVFDLSDRIRAAAHQKPVWAAVNDIAYSAAYALASSTSRIFVSRTGGVGSIGVIAMHVDQSARDAQQGLRYTAVFAGERKNDLNPHAPLSTDAQQMLQGEVDRLYGLFVDTVASHRGMKTETVRQTQAGVFFGEQAVLAGLADVMGNFDAACQAFAQHLGLTTQEVPQLATTDVSEARSLAAPPAPLPPQGPTHADARAIATLCTLARQPHLIASFLANQTPPSEVRAALKELCKRNHN